MNEVEMYEVTMSVSFWLDHATVFGDIGSWLVVRIGRKTVTVRMDVEAKRELRSNALRQSKSWFYWVGEKAEMRAGIARANRVLQAIVNAKSSKVSA
jgi:acyl-CoA hydrolase